MIRYLLNLLIKFISLIIFLYKFSYTRSLFNKYIYISHPREIQDAETGPLNTLIRTSAVIIERYHICLLVQKPESVQGYTYVQ